MIPKWFIERWCKQESITIAEVNTGRCECFAIAACEFIINGEVYGTENFIDWDSPKWPGGHCWIFDGKRHYDIENPEGVENWKNLKFFKNKV